MTTPATTSREAIETLAEKLEKISQNSGFCALLDPAVDALRVLLAEKEAMKQKRDAALAALRTVHEALRFLTAMCMPMLEDATPGDGVDKAFNKAYTAIEEIRKALEGE